MDLCEFVLLVGEWPGRGEGRGWRSRETTANDQEPSETGAVGVDGRVQPRGLSEWEGHDWPPQTEGQGRSQGKTFRGDCGVALCRRVAVHEMRPMAGATLTAAEGPLWSPPSPATLSAPRLLTSRAQEPLAVGHGWVLGLQPAVRVDELLG